MSHILRAHQLCMEGYSSLFDKHLSTVWSAPNYCYRCGNSASILEVGPGQSMFFNVFEAAPENERDGPGQQMQFQQGKVTYSPSCSLPYFLYGLLHIVLDPRPFLFSIFPFPNTFGVSHAYVTDLTFILPTIIDYSVAQKSHPTACGDRVQNPIRAYERLLALGHRCLVHTFDRSTTSPVRPRCQSVGPLLLVPGFPFSRCDWGATPLIPSNYFQPPRSTICSCYGAD